MKWNVKRPLPILNECIQKRYRDQGYQVVFALYPDKEIFGIIPKEEDKITYTDILFSENSAIDENGNMKENFSPKYPDEKQLIKQLGDVEYLVVGGYHYSNCVKKVAEKALDFGIPTLIDLDLTDLFFSLYKQEDYFDIKQYDPKKYKQYLTNKRYDEEISEKLFYEIYSSPSFGFVDSKNKKTRL